MTVRKNSIVFYKCHRGCNYIVTNKSSFKKHLDSVSHMIRNRTMCSNQCQRCEHGDQYTGQHLNYHEMALEKNSVEEFNECLMNDRLKDFSIDSKQQQQAMEWTGNMWIDSVNGFDVV